MALKPIAFDTSLVFTRPDAAEYTDQNGDTQTAAIDEPRFQYVEGEFQGLLLDSLLSEEANISGIENFGGTAGAFILEGELDRCLPFPGSGFNQILSGAGKVYFTFSEGVGKCFANGALLYTVDPFTPEEPTTIIGGGVAKVVDCVYHRGEITDSEAMSKATGVFEIEDVWDFEADYKNQTFGSKDDRGAFIIRRFEDEHTFSRPSTKWALMDNGFYKEYASGEPAFDRDGLNLEKSSVAEGQWSLQPSDWTGGSNLDNNLVTSLFPGKQAVEFVVSGDAGNPHRNQSTFFTPGGLRITSTWILEQGTHDTVNLGVRSNVVGMWAGLQKLDFTTGELETQPSQEGTNVDARAELLMESGPNGGRVFLVSISLDVEESENAIYNRINLPADVDETIIVHYCMSEEGSHSTSPIATLTAPVTRAQDVLTIEDLTSKSWWGSIVGRTLYFELIPRYSSQDAGNSEVGAFYIRAENTPNEYLAYRSVNGNNTLGWTVYDSNGYVAGLGAQIEKDSLHRVAVSVYEDKIIAGVNGNISTIEHNMSYTSSFDVVSLNSNLGLASGCGDFIAFAVKEGNATQAELELLTTQ